MIVLISGRRYIDNNKNVYKLVSNVYKRAKEEGIQPTTIIHGNAKGFDLWSDFWAKNNNIERRIFSITSVEWELYGKSAGNLRNQKMIDKNSDIEACVILWDGKEKGGTWDMLQRMKFNKFKMFIYRLDKEFF